MLILVYNLDFGVHVIQKTLCSRVVCCIPPMQSAIPKDHIRALPVNSKCWRHTANLAKPISASEVGDVPQETQQQQLAVLVASCFPQKSTTGRSRPEDQEQSTNRPLVGKRRFHKHVVDDGDNNGGVIQDSSSSPSRQSDHSPQHARSAWLGGKQG
ncbi:hypothetical protein BJX76DRAFT_275783 [Aspergillus varians]